MTTELPLLLIGPLVVVELVDNFLNVTKLVVTTNPEKLEEYCRTEQEKSPSLMLPDQRWSGDIEPLEDGEIEEMPLPADIGLSTSADISKRLILFREEALLAICESKMSDEEIKKVLRKNGLPEVVKIQHEQ